MSEIAQHVRNCPHLHPVESLLTPPRSACVHSWGGDGGRRRAGLFWRVLASTTTSIIFFTFTTDLTLVNCGRSKCLSSRSEAGCYKVLGGVDGDALLAKNQLEPLKPARDTSVD